MTVWAVSERAYSLLGDSCGLFGVAAVMKKSYKIAAQ